MSLPRIFFWTLFSALNVRVLMEDVVQPYQRRPRARSRYHRVERSYGSFLRRFALPEGIDSAKVAAAYKNGVLEVTLPKPEHAQLKPIKVDVQ